MLAGRVATAALCSERASSVEARCVDSVPAADQLVELLAQRAPLGRREVAVLLHQQLDEVAVALVGRHAAGRGVRLGDQAGFFERRHLVAHGGRRQLTLVLAGDQVGRDGLGEGDVFLDDVAEDAFSARGELGQWLVLADLALAVPER